MKKITSLLMSLALASSVIAGAPSYSGKGGKIVNPPEPTCDYFAPGASVGAFIGGFLPKYGDDELGGGILGQYFFCKNFGLEVSYGAYATPSTHHEFDAALVARLPLEKACIAPYVMVGGGFSTNSETLGNYFAGAGLEAHITGKTGVFADGAYHWHSSSNRDQDFTLVRLGVKFRL